MTLRIRLFVILVLLYCWPAILKAKEIQYNHNSITISELKEEVDFSLLTPGKVPNGWTLEIKTSPWIMLHYMNKNDTKLMVAIHQKKANAITDDDLSKGHLVDINGRKGYFQDWSGNGKLNEKRTLVTGRLLVWIQDGTYVEMTSSSIAKKEMIKIARSMK
ncbi:DUF4367 domain-containing protein [Bacillus sp. SCS-153A]|uniref:DUF4367 domain-containing protein n=1 Tax=Rossellomorea sedimentorum TaxID=3115294 RepID=UPI0039058919